MAKELAGSGDFRAFALAAMKRPQEGGYFYARYVAGICGRDFALLGRYAAQAISNEVSQNSTIAASRLTAMESLARNCAGFTSGEASRLVADIEQASDRAADPLLSVESRALQAVQSRDLDQLRAAFAALARLNDPLLWSQKRLYELIVSSDPEAAKVSGGFYFDGKVYSPDDRAAYTETKFALQLGACRDGEACAIDHLVSFICAVGSGACASDRNAFVKSQYVASGGTQAGGAFSA